MRRRAPCPDSLLWRALTASLPQARFRRHVPLGPYVAGFASRSARLVVEVDDGGPVGAADASRMRFLNGQGYRVIRFWHADVVRDVAAVLDSIACALPPELLPADGPVCRLNGAAARAAWSPRPDLPSPDPEPRRDTVITFPAGVR